MNFVAISSVTSKGKLLRVVLAGSSYCQRARSTGSLTARPQNTPQFRWKSRPQPDHELHGAAETNGSCTTTENLLNHDQKSISWPPDRSKSPPPLRSASRDRHVGQEDQCRDCSRSLRGGPYARCSRVSRCRWRVEPCIFLRPRAISSCTHQMSRTSRETGASGPAATPQAVSTWP